MAVEAKRIKERLRSLYPKVNLSTRRLDEISARLAKKPADDADDETVDQVINDANDFMPFADIAREDDRVRNLEARANGNDPKPADPQQPADPKPSDPPQPPTDEMPAWAKTMMESNKKLLQEVGELKAGKITETKMENARKLFEGNETLKGLKETVKEKWLARIDVNSETPLEDQISELESEYTELVQIAADNKRVAGAPPNGSNGGKPTDEELNAIAGDL